jgi:hypothetical protein
MEAIVETHMTRELCKFLDFGCIFISLNSVSKKFNESVKNNVPLIERLIRIQDKIIFTSEIHYLKRKSLFDYEDVIDDKLDTDFLQFMSEPKRGKLLSYYAHCLMNNKPYSIKDNISHIFEYWYTTPDGENEKIEMKEKGITNVAINKFLHLLDKKKNIQYN